MLQNWLLPEACEKMGKHAVSLKTPFRLVQIIRDTEVTRRAVDTKCGDRQLKDLPSLLKRLKGWAIPMSFCFFFWLFLCLFTWSTPVTGKCSSVQCSYSFTSSAAVERWNYFYMLHKITGNLAFSTSLPFIFIGNSSSLFLPLIIYISNN